MTCRTLIRSVAAATLGNDYLGVPYMSVTDVAFVRRAAITLIVGATASAIGGIVVQAVVQPRTTVSDEMWSYPWSSGALVPISVLWASLHALVFAGLIGFVRSGLAGTSRGARVGAILALVGTALLFVGELASIPIRHEHADDAGATIVGAIFGVAVLLSAVGLLAAGVATLRTGLWRGWRRFTPLTAGVWTTALIGLGSTKALPAGVAVYGLCLLALGIALYTQTSPSRARTLPLAPQEQGT
jgi:hypothetical protein